MTGKLKGELQGLKIVVIGGGTGLSTMLRGLKKYTSNLTAIVTVGDDGGGSGALREDLGVLPPGDIRNCIMALANTEPIMEELLQYRFKDGTLKGQSFGNLFLIAMSGISDENFLEGVKKMSDVLAVRGNVLPVTEEPMTLVARLSDNSIIEGESAIPKEALKRRANIERLSLNKEGIKALQESVDAILEADMVVLGPGSLYTSVIANLLVDGIPEALKKTEAIRVYVSNIMTQPGETDGYSVSNHVEALFNHSNGTVVDYVIANSGKIDIRSKVRYIEENSYPVTLDKEKLEEMGLNIVEGDYINDSSEYIRHDYDELADTIIKIYSEKRGRR